MKVKSESEVSQSCLTLSDPRDCSPLGSSVHGIFQARVLEWGAIAFSVDGLIRSKWLTGSPLPTLILEQVRGAVLSSNIVWISLQCMV